MTRGARRRGRFGPQARLRVRTLLQGGRRRSSLWTRTRGTLALPSGVRARSRTPLFRGFVIRRSADNSLLEPSSATGGTSLRGLFEATAAVTDDKTGNLSQNMSRVAS